MSDAALALYTIQEGHFVILTKGEHSKLARVERGREIKVGKTGLKLDSAIGQPLDAYYEILKEGLKRFDMNDVLADVLESSEGSNQFLLNENSTQKLSAEQIQNLKKTTESGQDIIQQLVENSTTFKQKTEFSQAKYIKKKQMRHLNVVRIARPTALTLCEMLFLNDPFKILQLRVDTLAHLLLYANVRAGVKAMVVDGCGGLVTGACAERLGGFGSLLQIHGSDLPLKTYLEPFNLPASSLSIIRYISFLHLGRVLLGSTKTASQIEGAPELTPKEIEREETIAHFKEGNFDSLIVASRHSPSSVLFPLLNYMAPSRPFAAFCQYIEPLVECASKLKREAIAVNVQLLEVSLTHYQVLPNRTHPDMTTSATGGFLLFGTVAYSRNLVGGPSAPPVAVSSVKRTASEAGSASDLAAENGAGDNVAAALPSEGDEGSSSKRVRLEKDGEDGEDGEENKA